MLRLIAFDQSSTKTGYAIFTGIDLTRWGVIDFSKESDTSKRIEYMCYKIDTLIKKINPDIVVFEDVNLRTSVKTLIMLAQIQGCIMQSCFIKGIEFAKYSPVTWRKLIGIKQGNKTVRNDLKEQAIAFVRNSYGINVGDDCAEGICLGLAYLKQHELLPDLDNLRRSSRKENYKETTE